LETSADDMVFLENGYFVAVLGKERTGKESTHTSTDDANRMWMLIIHLQESVRSVCAQ